MYDSCGHGHCTRLSDDQMPLQEKVEDELALWLWEVHNSVNLRLMKESAEREHRNITKEEIISSKFPSKGMCPNCWLDVDQNSWDSSEMYKFLRTWYWPTDEYPTIIASRNMSSMESSYGNHIIWSRFYLAVIPLLLYVVYLFFKKEYLTMISMGSKWKQNKSQ